MRLPAVGRQDSLVIASYNTLTTLMLYLIRCEPVFDSSAATIHRLGSLESTATAEESHFHWPCFWLIQILAEVFDHRITGRLELALVARIRPGYAGMR